MANTTLEEQAFQVHAPLKQKLSDTYIQSLKHYPRLARGARVGVSHLLPHCLQQPLVISGRCDGLGPDILHRAESLRPQIQIVETLLQLRVSAAGHTRIYRENTQGKQPFNGLLFR